MHFLSHPGVVHIQHTDPRWKKLKRVTKYLNLQKLITTKTLDDQDVKCHFLPKMLDVQYVKRHFLQLRRYDFLLSMAKLRETEC